LAIIVKKMLDNMRFVMLSGESLMLFIKR